MTDPFARQTAQHAHQRVAELALTVQQLRKEISRRRQFAGRCHLCGDPVTKGSVHCRAHSWAGGS